MKNSGKILLSVAAVLIALLVFSMDSYAGTLEPPASATDSLGNPVPTTPTPPSWSKNLPADDGDPVTGCGSSRFECVLEDVDGDGVPDAVLDKETGLVWERSPDNILSRSWEEAVNYCHVKSVGTRHGWRLPAIEELTSLLDNIAPGESGLPIGHPFIVSFIAPSLNPSRYWSNTTVALFTQTYAHELYFINQQTSLTTGLKANISDHYAWCVRGRQVYDAL